MNENYLSGKYSYQNKIYMHFSLFYQTLHFNCDGEKLDEMGKDTCIDHLGTVVQ